MKKNLVGIVLLGMLLSLTSRAQVYSDAPISLSEKGETITDLIY